MSRRSPETLADYLVVAIAPALIMFLVGSLMWFLVEVFYQGEHKGRLMWIMAMFVIAIVGIARISIEEGLAYASLFGWALAAAIGLALARLVENGLAVGGPIMAVVWWAAHKLTWDCTVVDEDQDVSGQGLLQQMGLDSSAGTEPHSPGTEGLSRAPVASNRGHPLDDVDAVSSAVAEPSPPWWETLLEPDRRPHAPGVWVVYFSLAALPLFGVGGWFVPSADGPRRALVFGLLVIYVASGMGLLLATSFLGLRRYLRQRKLEMPVEMTTTWILVGVVMIFAMLLVAAILPRPSREYSLSQLPFTITSAARRASRIAFGKEGTKDDEAEKPATIEAKEEQTTDRKGAKSAKGEADQQQGSEKGESKGGGGKGQSSDKSDKSSGGKEGKGKKDGESKGGESKGGESKSRNAESRADKGDKQDSKSKTDREQNEQRDAEQPQRNESNEQKPPPEQADNRPAPSPSENRPSPAQILSQAPSLLMQSLGTVLKWVFYLGLIGGAVVAAWIYREELRAAWQKLLAELSELWDWWFGTKKVAPQAAEVAAVVAPPRAFASYIDPFASGDARGMSWPQLVRYTFEALEAWGRERACPRGSGQTPHEFAAALASRQPHVATGAQTLAAWYGQLAYAPKAAAPGSVEPLRELWLALGRVSREES